MTTHRLKATAEHIETLIERVRAAGDTETTVKLTDVVERAQVDHPEVYVAFCGLFSAGKSSLINQLVGDHALSTGAVPTTAQVHPVRLETPSGHIVLLDTPGVDSTDEAHQAATEAALHRADAIAFVMDYQHVEAEEHMEMARQFLEQGKRLFIVVNQVDKHVDWELSFSDFQRRIERTFQDYGIIYEGLFYTSTKPSAHSHVDALVAALDNLAANAETVVRQSVERVVEDLIAHHVDTLFARREQDVEADLYDTVGYVPFDTAEAADLRDEKQRESIVLREGLDTRRAELRRRLQAAEEEFVRMISLAQIAPYETTERGRQYVESMSPSFKVGWLGAQKKTEAERQSRLAAFVADLGDRTEKFLVWPLQSRLREWIGGFEFGDESWLKDVDRLTVTVSEGDCVRLLKSASLSSDNYPYQYVKDVVASVKANVQAALHQVLDQWIAAANQAQSDRLAADEQSLQDIQRNIDALAAWLTLHEERVKASEDILRDAALVG